jgi:fructose-1,6-bisphosphatase I
MATNSDQDAGAVGKESINTEIMTLTRFLNEEQTKHREATGDFTYVWCHETIVTAG